MYTADDSSVTVGFFILKIYCTPPGAEDSPDTDCTCSTDTDTDTTCRHPVAGTCTCSTCNTGIPGTYYVLLKYPVHVYL